MNEADFATLYKKAHPLTYYHYYPSIEAMIKLGEVFVDEMGLIWLDEDKLLFYNPKIYLPDNVTTIQVLTPQIYPGGVLIGWKYELFDRNYIHDLSYTINLENFRRNVSRFVRDNKYIQFVDLKPEIAIQFLFSWYEKRFDKDKEEKRVYHNPLIEFYLIKNKERYPGMRLKGLYTNEELIGITLWGKLSSDTAIHIICRDNGVVYAHDYLRARTYMEMLDEGYVYVNDGSDLGLEGLRKYKSKLRPHLIIPVYSGVKK